MKPDFEKVVIHHAAMPDSRDDLDLPTIRWFHVHERGWVDIGYHALVERVQGEPVFLMARPWYLAGAHAKGHNHTSFGVCIVGNFSVEAPDEELLRYAATAVASVMHALGVSRLVRHSDLAATECPGTRFPWDRFVGLVEGILGHDVEAA